MTNSYCQEMGDAKDNSAENKSTQSEDVQMIELYRKGETTRDNINIQVPYAPLNGEYVTHLGRICNGVLALSNFRLFYADEKNFFINIPLGSIDKVEITNICFIDISRKDLKTTRLKFRQDHCHEWYRRITNEISAEKRLEDYFAFSFYAWSTFEDNEKVIENFAPDPNRGTSYFTEEITRLGLNASDSPWRISYANRNYALCATYPKYLVVPASINDNELFKIAEFRKNGRLPVVVWRHKRNGAVIARCAQPGTGIFFWRSNLDEKLIAEISRCCHFSDQENHKMFIMDARSYSASFVNRVSGGGCESDLYYNSEVGYMDLPNIHVVRNSANSVRSLLVCEDTSGWLTALDKTGWLQSISRLLNAASLVVRTIEDEARPVLVHCSDGWDRTPQIVSLAQLLLDPYYRTVIGFEKLIHREWLEFGHKFSDRLGSSECSPVFLQWLDCVHQLLHQFPCHFEFSEDYLLKVVDHLYSNLFGTFLCNSDYERDVNNVANRTYSIWPFLQSSRFRNALYVGAYTGVLRPRCDVRYIVLWERAYSSDLTTPEKPLQESGMDGIFAIRRPSETEETNSSVASNGETYDVVVCYKTESDDGERLFHSPVEKTEKQENIERIGDEEGNDERESSSSTITDSMIMYQQMTPPDLDVDGFVTKLDVVQSQIRNIQECQVQAVYESSDHGEIAGSFSSLDSADLWSGR